MTGEEFKAAVREIGWKYADCARHWDKSEGMIKQYAAGNANIPVLIEKDLQALVAAGGPESDEEVIVTESPMMEEKSPQEPQEKLPEAGTRGRGTIGEVIRQSERESFQKAVFKNEEETAGKEEAREEMVESIVEEIMEEEAETAAIDKPRGQARIAAINEFLEEHYGLLRDDSPDKVIVDLTEKLLEERGLRELRKRADTLRIDALRRDNANLKDLNTRLKQAGAYKPPTTQPPLSQVERRGLGPKSSLRGAFKSK